LSHGSIHLKIVVAGLGPTGISVVRELIRNHIPERDILVVDASLDLFTSKPSRSEKAGFESIYQAVLRERSNGGLGKNGQSLINHENKFATPSSVWGTSCLPPCDWNIGTDKFSKNQVAQAYGRVSKEMEIQAEESSDFHFQISGEEIGKLKRKLLSKEIASIQEFSHSRLAIRTIQTDTNKGCTQTGNCFVDCPNNAPWNPGSATKSLLAEFPEIQFRSTRIVEIDVKSGSIVTRDSIIKFDKLYLGIGAVETRRLLQMNFSNTIMLETTPVVILPLYFRYRQNTKDYFNSFLFADLIAPKVNDSVLTSVTQIYLPTKEITARAISRLPRILHRILGKSMRKLFTPIFQRIGVAMVFLKATDIDDHQLNLSEYEVARKDLRRALKKASIRIIPGKKELLLMGASYHYGAIRFENEENKGIDSMLFSTLSSNEIYITDTSALPHLPPGPHTSISACLAKLIVEESLK
jgi:hypothetical protein